MALPSILTPEKTQQFDNPPKFKPHERLLHFRSDDFVIKVLPSLKTPINKVGFVLQYTYFKVTHKFFSAKKFRKIDVNHVCRALEINPSQITFKDYSSRVFSHHKTLILKHMGYTAFDEKIISSIDFSNLKSLNEAFHLSLQHLRKNCMEVPSYRVLAPLISKPFDNWERETTNHLEGSLNEEMLRVLDDFYKRIIRSSTSFTRINQSLKVYQIQESLEEFRVFKESFSVLEDLFYKLNLSPSTIEYYATWVYKAQLIQIKNLKGSKKLYLHLICYIYHQYCLRQDYLADILIRSVQASINATKSHQNKLNNKFRDEQKHATHKIIKSCESSHKVLSKIALLVRDKSLSTGEKISSIDSLILIWEKKDQLDQHIQSLQRIDQKSDWFDALEKQSVKLQRRVSGILKVLGFNHETSKETFMDAIGYFRKTDGDITSKAPTDLFKPKEKNALLKDSSFRVSLYKILFFMKVAEGIKSGDLNLKHSYRYKALEEYLIPKSLWESQKDELIQKHDLEEFKDFHKTMSKLKRVLDKKYQEVNKGLKNNPYLYIDAQGRPNVKTPKIETEDFEYINSLLQEAGQIPLYQLLITIDEITRFSKHFQHFSLKHSKMKLTFKNLCAGIMALGLNHGISIMARMSEGISEKSLRNIINWYFSLKNIEAAYGCIADFIGDLPLPDVFKTMSQKLVTGSDGRKVPVKVASLNANHSYKYPGKGRVASVYSFLDEKQRLYYTTVITSTDREAPYVIDGITHNDSIKSSIHSVDSFGYTEQVAGVMACLKVSYAPRFKQIKKQRIYAFEKRKDYVKKGYKILPYKRLNLTLMEENWDSFLRFMVTIKSKHTSASQLFKRLSSYAKNNPLYKAIKEFGRIHKSIYILSYFQDKELRQLVQKTLNRVEHSNKFTKAISFANNQEFLYETKEEQDIAIGCTTLIQNAIVLWNYLYISQKILETKDPKERAKMIKLIRKGSFLCWGHLNFHGEYNFSTSNIKKNIFDMDAISKLKI